MRRSMMAIVIAVNLFSAGGVSAAGNWDLRRNVGNGACFIQPSDSSSIGRLLKTHPTRKAACDDAKARRTDDIGDMNKCFGYTDGTPSLRLTDHPLIATAW